MRSVLVIALGLTFCIATALAAFDGSQSVTGAPLATVKVEYRIHETPGDARSRVAFTIALWLERVSTTGNQVAWHAGIIEFRRKGADGAADVVWIGQDVLADTLDGLWRVTHANASTPTSADFVLPPRYRGTAIALIATNPDLDFDFRGRDYVPPEGGAPYAVTAGLDWDVHTAVGPEIPPGTDEPGEVPPVGTENGGQ